MQCENMRGTAGAMSGGSSDEPLPGEILDAAGRSDRRRRHHGRDRRARPSALDDDCSPSAEGRWTARIDGLICLQREADRCAEEWVRTRDPRAEGLSALIAIETLRTLALRYDGRAQPAHEEPVPTEDLGRLALALRRIESADRLRIEREQGGGRCRRSARRSGRARGQYDACRTGRDRPPGSWRGTSSLGAQTRRRRQFRVGRSLCRGLPRHPAGPHARVTCRRRRGTGCVGRAQGAGYVGRAQGAGYVGRAQGAGCGGRRRADSGRPTLPSAPRNGAGRGEAGGFRLRRKRAHTRPARVSARKSYHGRGRRGAFGRYRKERSCPPGQRNSSPRAGPFRPARPGPWCGARRARRACALQCTNERATAERMSGRERPDSVYLARPRPFSGAGELGRAQPCPTESHLSHLIPANPA